MKTALLALLATGLVAAAPGQDRAQPGDGYLAGPTLPGFEIGHTDGDGQQWIMEQVPRGESVHDWTRMITTQRFNGIAGQTTPKDYLGVIARSLPQSCKGAHASDPVTFTVSGRPAAKMRADCPNNPETHLPETFEILAISGPRDLHVRQVAFRYVPSPEDIAWAESYLASTTFCPPLSKTPACRILTPD
ncbi:hypothetical protein RXV95_10370 [Novosphingobium sp. ZN18A2]|uniref:hypothetical protein n=1 Tax=Novosphingobium sp. ZN18A2 TaxID=3079861 RepID=UPI0030D08073